PGTAIPPMTSSAGRRRRIRARPTGSSSTPMATRWPSSSRPRVVEQPYDGHMPAAAFLRSLLAPARTGLLGLATVVLISGLLALFMIVVVASGAAGTEVATVPVL